jgi:hypothetical protein
MSSEPLGGVRGRTAHERHGQLIFTKKNYYPLARSRYTVRGTSGSLFGIAPEAS